MPTDYDTQPVYVNGQLADIVVRGNGSSWHFWGRGGATAEASIIPIPSVLSGTLPVLIGTGLCSALDRLLAVHSGPIAVVDRSKTILPEIYFSRRLQKHENLTIINDNDPEFIIKELSNWQSTNNYQPMLPIALTPYLRLVPTFYRTILSALQSDNKPSSIPNTAFHNYPPRILLLDSGYYLIREIISATRQMNVPLLTIDLKKFDSEQTYFQNFLLSVQRFRPDMVLTVNNLGLDFQGGLIELLEKLSLPLASWFVDSPTLAMGLFQHDPTPWITNFMHDSNNIETLRSAGHEHVHYLPLATDPTVFRPKSQGLDQWHCDVSFVGDSKTEIIANRLKSGNFPPKLIRIYKKLSRNFLEHPSDSSLEFIEKQMKSISAFSELNNKQQKIYEELIYQEASRLYRKQCLGMTTEFSPLIVGDKYWNMLLKNSAGTWKVHPKLDYYTDLPGFYGHSKINLNITSAQMKGAPNQRVFDVPACGSFLLTDHRSQITDLFDSENEIVFFHCPEELPKLIRELLNDPDRRKKVSRAARKRILFEHTYVHRLKQLFVTMKSIYG